MTAVKRFTPLQRGLHWLMAVCILAMLFIGVGMVSTIEPKYLALVSIHKPLGMAILILALIRLAVRLRSGAPPLPMDLPEPMKLAAHLSHYVLYILMIAMPLIGWGMMSAAAYPVKLWDGVYLLSILPQSESLHTALWNAHFYLAFLFFAVILMHLAAALFHALIRRDGVSMRWGRRSRTTRLRQRSEGGSSDYGAAFALLSASSLGAGSQPKTLRPAKECESRRSSAMISATGGPALLSTRRASSSSRLIAASISSRPSFALSTAVFKTMMLSS